MLRIEWPANSPDLNCIENLWPKMKRRNARASQVKKWTEMLQFLPFLWGDVVPADFNKFIESMPDRCKAVTKAKGGHIRW
jgi:hypothetical protein